MKNIKINLLSVFVLLISSLFSFSLMALTHVGHRYEVTSENFDPDNMPPKLSVSVDKNSVVGGETVNLTATVIDPEGDNISYFWQTNTGTLNCTGNCSSATWTAPTVTENSSFTIFCEVGDGKGLIDTKEVDIIVTTDGTVDTTPPVVSLSNPYAGKRVVDGDVVSVQWSGFDDQAIDHYELFGYSVFSSSWSLINGSIGGAATQINWTATTDINDIRIDIFDSSGNKSSDSSGVFNVETNDCPNAPETPRIHNQPVSTINNFTTVSWDSVECVSIYELYIAKGDAYSKIGEISTSNTEYLVTNLENDTYYFKVKAVNDSGESGWSSVTQINVNVNIAPPKAFHPFPANGAVNVARTNVELGWDSDDDPNGDNLLFSVYLGKDPNTLPSKTGFGSTYTYDAGTLDAGTTYYWRIDSKDEGGLVVTGETWNFTTEGGMADLTAININVTDDVILYNDVEVSVTVQNLGGYPTNVATLEIYLSDTENELQTFINSSYMLIPELEPGQQIVLTKSVTVSEYPAMDFYFVANIDPGISEDSNPDNNVTSVLKSFVDTGVPEVSWSSTLASDGGSLPAEQDVYLYVAAYDDGNVASCDIHYTINSGTEWNFITTITEHAENSPYGFAYNWEIPISLVGEEIQFKATCIDDGGHEGFKISGTKSVIHHDPPTVRVVWPNGGETLLANTTYTLRWEITAASGVRRVIVRAVGCGMSGGDQILDEYADIRSMEWTTPDTGEVYNCKIYLDVQDNAMRYAYDQSDAGVEIKSTFEYSHPWTRPMKPFGTISADGNRSNSFVIDDQGNIYMVAVHDNDLYFVKYTNSTATWSSPKLLLDVIDDGYIWGKPEIALDTNNSPHVTFTRYWSSDVEVYHTYQISNGTWSSVLNISNDSQRDTYSFLILGSDATLYAFWNKQVDGEYFIVYKIWDGSIWSSVNTISHSNIYNTYMPQYFVDELGDIHIFNWSSEPTGIYEVVGTHSKGFSDQKRIVTLSSGNSDWDMNVDSNGLVHFVWSSYSSGSEISYATYDGNSFELLYTGDFGRSGIGNRKNIVITQDNIPYIIYHYDVGAGKYNVHEARAYVNGSWSTPQTILDPVLGPDQGEVQAWSNRIYVSYSHYSPAQINYAELTGDVFKPTATLTTTFSPSYPTDTEITIEWTESDNEAVTSRELYWIDETATEHLIGSFPDGTLSHTWTTPNEAHQAIKIKLVTEDAAGNKGIDSSSSFDIVETVLPVVNITAPMAAVSFNANDPIEIIWTATDNDIIEKIGIYFKQDSGSAYEVVAENLENSGSFSWKAPFANTQTAQIKIVATDKSGNEGEAATDGFTIVFNEGSELILYTLIPSNNAILRPVDTDLDWELRNSTGETALHDVYFSTVEADIDNKEETAKVLSASESTNVDLPQLSLGAAYFWRVEVIAGTMSYDTGTKTFSTATDLLLAPTNLTASNLTDTSVTLNWTDNSNNEDGFKIEISSDGENYNEAGDVIADTATFDHTGLTANETVYFRVYAYNSNANSLHSNILFIKSGNNQPNTPTLITPTDGTVGVSVSESTLIWSVSDPDVGDTLYSDIYFSEQPNPSLFAENIITSTFSLPILENNHIYYWKVIVKDQMGAERSSVTNWFVTTNFQLPSAPSGLTATINGNIDLIWNDNSDNEEAFKVEKRIGPTGSWSVLANIQSNKTAYTDSYNILPDSEYEYRIAACNPAGCSVFSNVAIISLPNTDPEISPEIPTISTDTLNSRTVNLAYYKNDETDSPALLTYTVSDVDALLFSAVISGDELTINPVGVFGSDEIVLTLTDSSGGTDTQTVIVNIEPEASVPLWSVIADLNAKINTTEVEVLDLWDYVEDSIVDDSLLILSIAVNTAPECGATIENSHFISLYPTLDWSGNCVVTMKADNGINSSTQDISIQISKMINGEICDNDSDCEINHCENGFCCGSGVCCATSSDCSDTFNTDPTCDNTFTCQGIRKEKSCGTNFQCESNTVDDDSACSNVYTQECDYYSNHACSGLSEQTTFSCPITCADNTNCDNNATCFNSHCVAKFNDGDNCNVNEDCDSNHCQNGFCCDSGDCCFDSSACPDSYKTDPVCDDTTSCQGSRVDKICTKDNKCDSQKIEDDSACTTLQKEECGYYKDNSCSGETDQQIFECSTTCIIEADCDNDATCVDNLCVPKLNDGETCSKDDDCGSGHCENGFCCESGDCCNQGSDCPNEYTYQSICDYPETCQGHGKTAECSTKHQCSSKEIDDDSACNSSAEQMCEDDKYNACDGKKEQDVFECPEASDDILDDENNEGDITDNTYNDSDSEISKNNSSGGCNLVL